MGSNVGGQRPGPGHRLWYVGGEHGHAECGRSLARVCGSSVGPRRRHFIWQRDPPRRQVVVASCFSTSSGQRLGGVIRATARAHAGATVHPARLMTPRATHWPSSKIKRTSAGPHSCGGGRGILPVAHPWAACLRLRRDTPRRGRSRILHLPQREFHGSQSREWRSGDAPEQDGQDAPGMAPRPPHAWHRCRRLRSRQPFARARAATSSLLCLDRRSLT